MDISDIRGTTKLNNGVQMPYLGLGVWQCKNDDEVINSVTWAFEAGYRHIDTASIYQNEEGVGLAIAQSGVSREDLFIVSKLWNSDQGYESTLVAYEESLNKLQLEYLDLYLIHWPVAGKYIESWKALEHLYNNAKVRAIGVSNFLQHQLEDLLQSASVIPMVNQMEFHPYLIQKELLDFCTSNSIQYEAWSPIMKGKAQEVEALQQMAKRYETTAIRLTLRWCLQKGVIAIPKSSKKERIYSNADLFRFNISDTDMNVIDELDQNYRFGPDPDNFNF